jgi:hypothetical protein
MRGWAFWVNNEGRFRSFTVGAENEDAAKLAIQTEHPSINFLNFESKELVGADIINFLTIGGGKLIEWVPVEKGDTLTPRGVPMEKKLD